MNKTLIILILFVITLALSFWGGYLMGRKTIQPIATPPAHNAISNNNVPYKPSVEYRKDTITVTQKVNIDSIYQVAKEYWKQFYEHHDSIPTGYIAQVDTNYSDAQLSAHVAFVSRIPLDPKGFFRLNFDYLSTPNVAPLIRDKRLPNYYTSLGIALHLKSKPIYYGGFGTYIFNSDHFEIPIGVQFFYQDKLDYGLTTNVKVKL